VRRSKVQRQEARRERRGGLLGARKAKDDRRAEARWVVVEAADCRVPKYLVNGNPAGFERELADSLAKRAHPDQREYTVVDVEVFAWARALGEPVSAARAVAEFVPEDES
jgi:hypothetical protein